ncbi:DNA repair protein RecN (Recombination protein N) [Dethiosulfovibrio salsuginis]|uniref:DNA repair protein RecN n=1 Tax=Dethiosulfovibrio salsuginis TaxID=561720 RepID=A0A1X7I451_9BACT|nr:DNA repair protein RecN (Recombination protein N) [Dethiosulfovibrio salsuginis]
MIEEVHLENIGGIEEAQLCFSPGLTAITGESGAGKSSLVRALELVAGKRSASTMIKAGSDNGSVEAIFNSPSSKNLPPWEEGKLFIKREVNKNGRGRVWVQNRQVPLSTLSELSRELITIQSQFAQLELLNQDNQLQMVDSCGGPSLAALKKELKSEVKSTIEQEKRLLTIKKRQREITDRFQKAEDIVHRWRKMEINKESETTWEEDHRKLSSELARMNDLRKIRFRMKNDEPGSLKEELEDIMEQVLRRLPQENREEVSGHIDLLLESYSSILSILDEAGDEENRNLLEESVEELESKMGALRKLKRTAGVANVEELIDYCEEADRELEWLRSSNDLKNDVERQVEEHRKSASRMALELRRRRKEASLWLESRVNLCLSQMAMEDSLFSVGLIEESRLRTTGAESVEFRLSWGKGDPGPVSKMASGGELSRILLAIRLSLPDDQFPSTVVFDEVEAGLGGKAAVLAGIKLKELSNRCQVILITHEATIAAQADCHMVVRRKGNESYIEKLDRDGRVSEIARMLSGDFNLEEAKSHAAKLLDS